MVNPNKKDKFEGLLGICGPEYIFSVAEEMVGEFCLAKVDSTSNTAYIHDITIGRGIDKEYTTTATTIRSVKKSGWYICKYTGVKDEGYDETGYHICTPIINPLKFIKDCWICDDKSPMTIFLLICCPDFGCGHVTSFKGSPLESINLSKLIRLCSTYDKLILPIDFGVLDSNSRRRMMSLFLKNDINVDLISALLDPYHIRNT